MSDRRLLAIAMALEATIAIPGGAQSPSPATDSSLRDIRRLDSVMVIRARAVDSVRRSLVRPAPPVELSAGPLRVRTDSTLAPRVGEAVRAVTVMIDRRHSAVVAGRVAGRVSAVTRDSTRWL